MVKVDVGPYIKEVHACAQKKDCAKPGKSDFARAPVVTGITNKFAESNPDIAELMSKVSFTNDQLNGILAWQEKETASAEEAAVYFLTNNKDVWSNWLNDSAKKNLAALLK
jgi:glycine betaine/proline transport system substrate-binding protein